MNMNVDTFNGNPVEIGHCASCDSKRVVIRYHGEAFCTRCIEKDSHLKTMIGWR
ncbi:MAG: hypothetical protein ACMXYE_01850 [Candidatus Woesearchaeota archaeon]